MWGDVGFVVGPGRDLTGMALYSGMELFSLRPGLKLIRQMMAVIAYLTGRP